MASRFEDCCSYCNGDCYNGKEHIGKCPRKSKKSRRRCRFFCTGSQALRKQYGFVPDWYKKQLDEKREEMR